MSGVEIYHKQVKISAEIFRRDFLIMEDLSGELFWQSDPQANDKGGIIKVWIQHADTSPNIDAVLPDWQLIIDGVQLESKFYNSIKNLRGKIVELQHGEYAFKFHFPQVT